MKIAVVGAGLFGVTVSVLLAKNTGYRVHLFDKAADVLGGASQANQLRLHRGYHYPRGERTVRELQKSIDKFERMYGNAIDKSYDHYYCIAREDSLVSAREFVDFCAAHDLEYEVIEGGDLPVNRDSVELIIKADEHLVNYQRLKKICKDYLRDSRVTVELSRSFTAADVDSFDVVINCTYSNLNELARGNSRTDYQFEVCEKIIVKPPSVLQDLSIVILDGPFMCIDPWAGTGCSLLGNVVHAIHSSNVGEFPEVPDNIRPILNQGPVSVPAMSRFDEFINSSRRFFEGIEESEYVSSMFTIRALIPNLEETDDRPTCVFETDDRVINVFSGKLDTCVLAYEKVKELVDMSGCGTELYN